MVSPPADEWRLKDFLPSQVHAAISARQQSTMNTAPLSSLMLNCSFIYHPNQVWHGDDNNRDLDTAVLPTALRVLDAPRHIKLFANQQFCRKSQYFFFNSSIGAPLFAQFPQLNVG